MRSSAAFRLLAVVVAVGGLRACAFDQTHVPALPDDVLHFTPGGEPDTVGPAGCDATCGRAEPTPDDFGTADGPLTGTWARRVVQRTERDTREDGNYKDSSWTTYERVTVLQQGTKLRETTEVCAITMPLIDGAQSGFPARLIENLPVLLEEGEFLAWKTEGDVVGATYENPTPLVRLFGLSPAAANKEWEPCGSYFDDANPGPECPLALWPEIVDTDCDCHLGITLDMTVGAAATEQVYMVQRDVMTRTGTVESADRIAGTLTTYDNNAANLGSTQAMLKANPPSRVVEGASTFVMVRLGDDAGCGDVQGAGFDQ
jgi:hypothetical protein